MHPVTADPRRFRYEKHDVFVTPGDDFRLFRYMAVTKYLDLIESGCLFFCQVDRLGDPFEGSWPKMQADMLRRTFRAGHEKFPILREREGGQVEPLVRSFQYENQVLRAVSAASCWHESQCESAALWEQYSDMDPGICVVSSPGRLRKALESPAGGGEEVRYFLGRVRYIDYETETNLGEGNTLWPLIYKRENFQHEREVRALVVDWQQHEEVRTRGPKKYGLRGGGIAARVSVPDLIDHVLVGPKSASWGVSVVERVTRRLGYHFPIQQSAMARKPVP